MTDDLPPGAAAERRFDAAGQRWFAKMSGDTNPMHMDPLAARRTQAGAPVVHGMHAVLWALDRLARDVDLGTLANITVAMNRFIYLGRPVTYRVARRTEAAMALDVAAGGVAVMTIALKFGPRSPDSAGDSFLGLEPADLNCAVEAADTLKGMQAWLAPAPGAFELAAAFPSLTRAIGIERVTGLTLLSTLVGMACPGLHSIFTAFQADLVESAPDRPGLGFRVRIADSRFRVVRMAVGGGGLSGTVSAFVRMPPMAPPGMTDLAGLVEPAEFAGQRVLVVGGSRGLGALSARLVVAGGGEAVLTYARGAADAAEVVEDIRAHRANAAPTVYPMNVTEALEPQLAAIEGPFTALLYFATPQIRRQKPAVFVPAIHEEFLQYYVHAFADLTALLLGRGGEAKLAVLYPSSVAVTDRPEDMTEYAMAKAAGEILAADLAVADPRLHMVIDRLGRLPTDQNATVVQAEFEDPIATMLPLLRRTLRGMSVG